jgi:hypothetical protein
MTQRNNALMESMTCLVTFLLLMLGSLGYVFAEPITIDFDDFAPGTQITDAYAQYGVKFQALGLYPEFNNDYNAYVYKDSNADTPFNVIGGRIIGNHYHWLNYGLCYMVAEFDHPVNMFGIYGAGDNFQVFYYNQNGVKRGPISSRGNNFLEISHENGWLKSDDIITKVEFGSWTGNYSTYFDDLTFNMLYEEDPVLTIYELQPLSSYPGGQISVFGNGFGDTEGDSTLHVANMTFDSGDPRIKLWTNTEIQIKNLNRKCEWFNGGDFRYVNIWLTVNGIDSNIKKFKVLKPDSCQ